MKRTRFTEEQIIGFLKQAAQQLPAHAASQVCRTTTPATKRGNQLTLQSDFTNFKLVR